MGNLGHVALLVMVWAGIVVADCSILSYIRAERRWRRVGRRRRDRLTW